MSPSSVAWTSVVMVVLYLAPLSHMKTVLILPFPFLSHIKHHTNVARALASRGHHVVVPIPSYLLAEGHLNTTGFSSIPYESIPSLEESFESSLTEAYFDNNPRKLFDVVRFSKYITDAMLNNGSFISTLRHQKPDLIVVDNLPVFYVMSIIPYRFGIPFAFVGPFFDSKMLRVPYSLAETPVVILPYSNKMTFVQRMHNTLLYMFFAIVTPASTVEATSTYSSDMDNLPLEDIVTRAEVFIVETDHVLDYPRPILPNVKLIGGTAAGPAEILPPEIKAFVDSAKQGVVIVSFGSRILHLPKYINDKIMQVLLGLPMKSIFRTDLTSPDPEKIFTSQWIPQNDLLGHANTKVFVTHCGYNSQYEALYHAVPLVAIPLVADQPYNAERGRVKGFAETLDLKTCTAEQLTSAILTVAREPRYKQAALKYSRLFREQYGVPRERAAYWLDHVMEYGGDYMRSARQEMPNYQLMLLDVTLCILCGVLVCLSLCCWLVCAVCKRVIKRKTKTN